MAAVEPTPPAPAPRFKIDVDEIQRGMFCAMMISVMVGVLYQTLAFSVTTVKAGVVNTWTIFAGRAQRTMETLVNPIEDLIMNADDQGAANLFERFPYPSEVRVGRKSVGIGSWKITRFTLLGANLDVLRNIEVDLEGVSQSEETFVEKPPTRDSERYDWPPRTLTAMSTSPIKAVVTVIGYGGSRWKHQLSVRLEDEVDDTVLASKTKKTPASAGPPAAGGTGTPTSPASGAATAPTPTPEADRDEGQNDLAQLVDALSLVALKRRAAYVKAIKNDAFEEAQLMSLLGELNRAKGPPAEIDAQISKVLSARYMQSRKVRGQLAPLHTASPSEVKQAMDYQGRASLIQEIDVAGSVTDGIRSVLGKVYTASLVPANPTSSASPGAIASAAPVPEGKLEESYFQNIWDQEMKYKDCMAIVDLLQKAYDVDNQDSVAPGPFDMSRLHSKGHLEYVPSCPDPGSGGAYAMEAASHKVRCTKHGNRALPWAERRLYEIHFNEFERARILVRKQNRAREAIGTLRAYLARDHGREEYNLIAQAYLGRLLFEDSNHEAAVEILKRLSDRYPKQVRLAYQTSLCFYVRANEQLALEYAIRAQEPLPSEFDRTFDEESTPYDLYLLRDECAWMQQFLAPQKLMPDGSKRTLPPVRYADFAIKSKPTAPAKTCYENLAKVRDMVARVVRGVRAKKEFQGRYQLQESQKDSLAKIPEYDKMPRVRTREALAYARRQLKDMSIEILRDAKLLGSVSFTPCPKQGVFLLANTKHLAVDCTAHPGILPAERIEISPAVNDREARMADLVLQHVMTTLSPPLAACVERQRRILEQYQTDVLDINIPTDAQLADLERDGKVPKGTLNPSADERYELVSDGEHRTLQCSVHYSLQRLAEKQDGVNLLEETKSTGGE